MIESRALKLWFSAGHFQVEPPYRTATMGVMRILGNLMIAYGPSAAILLQFIAPRSILFILTITR